MSTNHPFAGNPAAVCPLDGRDATWMQQVALEMNSIRNGIPVEGGSSMEFRAGLRLPSKSICVAMLPERVPISSGRTGMLIRA
jgi:hypothetical protein